MNFNYRRTEYYENEIDIIFPTPELEECEWIVDEEGWDFLFITSIDEAAINWAKALGCTEPEQEPRKTLSTDLGEFTWRISLTRGWIGKGHLQVTLECEDFHHVSEEADHYDSEIRVEWG